MEFLQSPAASFVKSRLMSRGLLIDTLFDVAATSFRKRADPLRKYIYKTWIGDAFVVSGREREICVIPVISALRLVNKSKKLDRCTARDSKLFSNQRQFNLGAGRFTNLKVVTFFIILNKNFHSKPYSCSHITI